MRLLLNGALAELPRVDLQLSAYNISMDEPFIDL
jgi:hypothetical protein